jgi:hypothetical protein
LDSDWQQCSFEGFATCALTAAAAGEPELEPERLPLVCVWFYLDVHERYPHKAIASVPHKAFAGVLHKAFASIRRNQVTSVPSHLVYSSVKENETMKPPL